MSLPSNKNEICTVNDRQTEEWKTDEQMQT